jgi:hypothetical protein
MSNIKPEVDMNFINKINEFIQENKLSVGSIQYPDKSAVGTSSICAHVKDGKGIVYCHTSGKYQGKVFYVPSGIGWFYKSVLKGSQSQIGLPISDEIEICHAEKVKQVRFEVGLIEYDPLTNACQAMSVFKETPL